MKFLGFEITRGCPECDKKDIELEGLRGQNRLLADHQLVLLDTIKEMRLKIERLEAR